MPSSAQYTFKAYQLVQASIPTQNFSPQLKNLIELQTLCNTFQTPNNIYNLKVEPFSQPNKTYAQAFIANLQHGCDGVTFPTYQQQLYFRISAIRHSRC